MTNLPVTDEFRVTCEYGRKGKLWASGYHKGIDLVCDNRNVYCTCDGVVKSVGFDKNGWGQYVRVDNGKGRIHIFCHFVKDSVRVKVGQKVNRATILGTMGSTGNSTGVHLHFQIEDAKRNVYDPTEWLGIPNKVGTYNSKNYQIEEKTDMKFNDDKKISSWAKDAVYRIAKKGIMSGKENGKFDPKGKLTREEFAFVIDKLIEKGYMKK